MSQLDKIRDDIAAIKDELARLADGHLSRDEAKQRASDWVDSKSAQFDAEQLGLSLAYASQGIDERHTRASDLSPHLDMGAFVSWLVADTVKQRLADALDALPDDAFGTDSDAAGRAKHAAQLEKQLHKLEVAEERAVCELERQGTPVKRRADVDPAIVLALPEEAA